MKCGRCFKTCNKLEVEAFGQCGVCQAKDILARDEEDECTCHGEMECDYCTGNGDEE